MNGTKIITSLEELETQKDDGEVKLKYGVSITDACVDWDMTMTMLDELNEVISPLSSVFLLTLMDLSNRL